jgi:hypothetical protein
MALWGDGTLGVLSASAPVYRWYIVQLYIVQLYGVHLVYSPIVHVGIWSVPDWLVLHLERTILDIESYYAPVCRWYIAGAIPRTDYTRWR